MWIQTHREQAHMKMEVENGVMLLQAKEYPGAHRSWRGQGVIFPLGS